MTVSFTRPSISYATAAALVNAANSPRFSVPMHLEAMRHGIP